jgi:RHS repeat-associated protein
MKKILLIAVLLLQTINYGQKSSTNRIPIDIDDPLPTSEVGITSGQLDVSLTGAATYSIPIALPPGINGVEPKVNLVYNSQSGVGSAGYGWSIGGLSSITRIPSTKFHDGIVDPVDLDLLDRFALDGQRLIVKSTSRNKTYGGHYTEYETENFSNIKVTSFCAIPTNPTSTAVFRVEYPDGSIAEYGGSTPNARTITNWSISYWQNAQGVKISYEYNNSNNNLTISKIKYGAVGDNTPINEVQFIYKNRQRAEQSFVGGESIINDKVLNSIKVLGNALGFRNYILEHDTALGYERLKSITEKSGDNTKSYSPTIFTYNEDPVADKIVYTTSTLINIYPDTGNISNGDFNGNGESDFIYNGYRTLQIFNDVTSNDANATSQNYALPNSTDFESGYTFTAKIIDDSNKIMARDAWCAPFLKSKGGLSFGTTFNVYSKNSLNEVQLEYSRDFNYPIDITGYSKYYKNLDGDFNGDGLTDVIMFPVKIEKSSTIQNGKAIYMNLDRRIQTNYAKELSLDVPFIFFENCHIKSADVNGDGKTDIVVFKSAPINMITVYSLDENENLIKLFDTNCSIPNPNIWSGGHIANGDFNGDGKQDFVIRGMPQNNSVINGTILLSSGSNFVTESFNTGNYVFNYFLPFDLNNDGKTEIVLVYAKSSTDKYISFRSYQRNFSGNWTAYQTSFDDVGNEFRDYRVVMYKPSLSNNGLNQLAILGNTNKITYFSSANNFANQKLLKNITLGSGITQTISYAPLRKAFGNQDPNTAVYSDATGSEKYPYIDIVGSSGFKVVSQLEMLSQSVYKKQLFKYHGAVSNVEGLGFLGFRAVMKTNWFNDTNPVISTISKFDVTKRGALREEYTVLGLQLPTYNFTTTDYIGKSVKEYNDSIATNKVFTISNTSSISYDGLTNTSKVATITYDAYNNPVKSINKSLTETSVDQVVTTDIVYETPTATPYIVGRPIQKNIVIKLSSGLSKDVTSTEEKYTYTTNNLLSQVEKKGHLTAYNIFEKNDYDSFGNIIAKTITAPNMKPRSTSYQYDVSGRFVIKKTNLEGLFATYTYNNNGILASETDPYGLTTKYFYDAWNKKIKTTDYLNKSVTTTYTKLDDSGIVEVAVKGDDSSQSVTRYDELGREIAVGSKNIDGAWSYILTDYDIYDRKISVSDPIATLTSSSPNFTTSAYDVYGRLIKAKDHTGKTTNISYNGLTSIATDGIKTVTTTKNAIGKVISSTDNGGTINYTYFANGNLKKSEYAGTVIEMEQDGWGRKTKLIDPSAGTYGYEYNQLGELTKEILPSPKGEIKYTINDIGKITEKVITSNDNLTSSKTTYAYDPSTQLLLSSTYIDYTNGSSKTDYTYTYDDFKRVTITTEKSPVAGFEHQTKYDDFGRPFRELYSSTNYGNNKVSNKWIKNTYKNGLQWQIQDDATSKVLWQTDNVNARGQLTGATLGNGIKIENTYDTYGYVSANKYNIGSRANLMWFGYDFEPKQGLLKNRYNSWFNKNEVFGYDPLNRLTEYPDQQGIKQFQSYDEQGRIVQNNIGKYNYTNPDKAYQNTSVELSSEATGYYQAREGIFNDGMETAQIWNSAGQTGLPIRDKAVVSYDDANVKGANVNSGIHSLKLVNDSRTKKVIHADKWIAINNTVDTEYTYSAWVYSDKPTADVYLFMKTNEETSYYTQVNNVTLSERELGRWVPISRKIIIPATIKKLNIRLDINSAGTVWFDDVKIVKTADATAERNLAVSYNAFKSPVQITETGIDKLDFSYNAFEGRSEMYYGGLEADKLQRSYRKFYSAGGCMEIKYNKNTGATEFLTYIGGDGYTAPVVLKSDGTTQNYLYLHRDYQGSILAITDETAKVLEARLFDAWGNIVKVMDGAGNTLSGLTVLDRGYTGHEHLQSVGLINMNARLYDPILHRFLQPDNYIQDPYNTQNYNRYGYVMNNPLKYSDPSGNSWIEALGYLFSAYVHGSQSAGDGNPLNWGPQIVANIILSSLSTSASTAATNYVNGNYSYSGGSIGSEINTSSNVNTGATHSYVIDWTRVLGGVQMIGGTFEAIVGGVGGVVSFETVVGPELGYAIVLNGIDNAVTGANQLWYGESQSTLLHQGVRETSMALGASEGTAEYVATGADISTIALGSIGSVKNFSVSYQASKLTLASKTTVIAEEAVKTSTSILKPLGLGSTGRTAAANLVEQLAMKEIMSNPTAGKTLINTMKDASGRWNGWSKMSNRTAHGVEIHYNALWEDGVIKFIDDFKFIGGK